MTGVALGTWDPGSDEWHEARRLRVGGSEIGTIMGWSPYQGDTRQRLMYIKAGLTEPKKTSAAMMRGHYCEGAVLAFLADRHNLTYAPDLSQQTFVHPEHDWALYNPDAIATDGTLVEAKTTIDRTVEHGWGRAGTDQIPLHYLAQVTWGMGILGADTCRVGVLHGATNGRPDLGFATYTVRFAPDIFATLLAAAEQFINDLTHLITTTERNAA